VRYNRENIDVRAEFGDHISENEIGALVVKRRVSMKKGALVA